MPLESVFGLDGSEFAWQHIPDCWSIKLKKTLVQRTWFECVVW